MVRFIEENGHTINILYLIQGHYLRSLFLTFQTISCFLVMQAINTIGCISTMAGIGHSESFEFALKASVNLFDMSCNFMAREFRYLQSYLGSFACVNHYLFALTLLAPFIVMLGAYELNWYGCSDPSSFELLDTGHDFENHAGNHSEYDFEKLNESVKDCMRNYITILDSDNTIVEKYNKCVFSIFNE